MTATHTSNGTTTTGVLYLAFELGDEDWEFPFSIGMGQKPRLTKDWRHTRLSIRVL
jgi:hypothetical protein